MLTQKHCTVCIPVYMIGFIVFLYGIDFKMYCVCIVQTDTHAAIISTFIFLS